LSRIVTISFTPLDAPGGVPKFNRDLHAAFLHRERLHFSWWDFPWCLEMEHLPEWEKARTLNHYLIQSRKLLPDDVVIADGFWADGLQHLEKAVSHSHGIWSHLTKEDVLAGKQPENPYHHAAQMTFRQRWTELGKRLTAVSDFIADEMYRQWGFNARVINNGVNTEEWTPRSYYLKRNRPLIIHGVNDRGNVNKGWDHIEYLKKNLDADVLSLDEAAEFVSGTKRFAMQQADFVVHPSGYEGNSMFVAEALSSGTPVVGYDVGFLWKKKRDHGMLDTGLIMSRADRTMYMTEIGAQTELGILIQYPEMHTRKRLKAREVAVEELSIERFGREWRSYIQDING
jgi:glycosyltransferase involved in cell wall biosynthesis